jgi:hypothetical protein
MNCTTSIRNVSPELSAAEVLPSYNGVCASASRIPAARASSSTLRVPSASRNTPVITSVKRAIVTRPRPERASRATRVTDEATLRKLAERYAAQVWPATVADGTLTAPYSAPSAGPAPWDLYAVKPATAYGVATAEPYGATRWRF